MTTTFALCPTTLTKLGSVATIGYHQPQAWQIVMRIVAEQGWFLVDIRADRRSSLEEWSGEFPAAALPLPHTSHEQPVLLRTARSQGVMLPYYGQCMLGLSLCLWMPPLAASSSERIARAAAQQAQVRHLAPGAASVERSEHP